MKNDGKLALPAKVFYFHTELSAEALKTLMPNRLNPSRCSLSDYSQYQRILTKSAGNIFLLLIKHMKETACPMQQSALPPLNK